MAVLRNLASSRRRSGTLLLEFMVRSRSCRADGKCWNRGQNLTGFRRAIRVNASMTPHAWDAGAVIRAVYEGLDNGTFGHADVGPDNDITVTMYEAPVPREIKLTWGRLQRTQE